MKLLINAQVVLDWKFQAQGVKLIAIYIEKLNIFCYALKTIEWMCVWSQIKVLQNKVWTFWSQTRFFTVECYITLVVFYHSRTYFWL
jgi:hypothetical protein